MRFDACNDTRYIVLVIKSFRHPGLEEFYRTGSKRGINPAHSRKLAQQLETLDRAASPDAMRIPGWNLHALAGILSDHWSVKVNGNWRLTFRFQGKDAVLVDYQDYH